MLIISEEAQQLLIKKKSCEDCYPEIDYLCSKHRPKNQCIGCLRTDQKLIITGMGIICRDCARKQGMIFI